MPRQFEPYPGELSAVYEPEADPPDINVEEWVPGTHRLPPNLTASEHVDWRDVNYLGQQILDLEAELEQNGDPTERYRWKQGDDKPTWDTAALINVRDLGAVGDGIADDTVPLALAFTQSETSGVPVLIPAGTYLTDTINYRGQSVYGVSSEKSIIRGKPGQDVFHVDNTVGAFTHQGGWFGGFCIQVDDSLDVAANFPNRGGQGNAGYALDKPDNNVGSPMILIDRHISDLRITGLSVTNGGKNNSAGIYTQNNHFSQCSFSSINISYLTWGWWDHYPVQNFTPGTTAFSRDHCRVDFIHFLRCANCWRLFGWGTSDINDVMFHGAGTVNALDIRSNNLHFTGVELAGATGVALKTYPDDDSYGLIFDNLSVSSDNPVTWEANDGLIRNSNFNVPSKPSPWLIITGHRNDFRLHGLTDPATAGVYGYDFVQDLGIGNSVIGTERFGPKYVYIHNQEGLTPDGRQRRRRDVGLPMLGYVSPMPISQGDLLINPRELRMASGGPPNPTLYDYIADSAADFGVCFRRLGTNVQVTWDNNHLNGIDGFKVGYFLPAGKIRVYVKAKMAVAGTLTWNFQAPINTVISQTAALPLGTTYSIVSFDIDLSTATAATTLRLQSGVPAGGGSGPIDIAWILFRPWAADWYVSGINQGQIRDAGGQLINVKALGAVGNGTADDTTVIAAAFALSDTSGVPVYLPPGTYLTDTIDYKMQSIIGAATNQSFLKGKPSKDVLKVNSTLNQFYRMAGTLRDFTILVDDTVNASASFTNRSGVGNAGIACDYPDRAVAAPPSMIDWTIEDLSIRSNAQTAGGRNKSCGIYTQNNLFTQCFVQNIRLGYLDYGWWDDVPNTGAQTSRDHIQVETLHFIGNKNHWQQRAWAFSHIANVMFHLPSVQTAWAMYDSHNLEIVGIELEGATVAGFTTNTGVYSCTFVGFGINGTPAPTTFNGRACRFFNLAVNPSPVTYPFLILAGPHNYVEFMNDSTADVAYSRDLIKDLALGNKVISIRKSGSFDNRRYLPESLVRDGRTAHQRDALSGLLGHVDPMFVGAGDLLTTPMLFQHTGGIENTNYAYVEDATADFGMVYRVLTGTAGSFEDDNWNGRNGNRVGTWLPPSRIRVYVKIKASVGGTADFILQSPNTVSRGNITGAPVTTSWSVVSFDADLTGRPLDENVVFRMQNLTGGGTLDYAWIMLRPWAVDWPVVRDVPAANAGDADKTLVLADAERQRWTSPLTIARTVTLPTTNVPNGHRYRITRAAASTGAFNLTINPGALKALATGQWADVVYDGAAWYLAAFGSL